MLRKPKLYNDDFLDEVGSLRDISKLKNLGQGNAMPETNFEMQGTAQPLPQPQAPGINPFQVDDVRKNESPYFKLGKYLGGEQDQQAQQMQLPESPQDSFNPSTLPNYAAGIAGVLAPNSIYKSLSGLSGLAASGAEAQQTPMLQPEMPQPASQPPQLSPELPQMPLAQAPSLDIPQVGMQPPSLNNPADQLMGNIQAQLSEKAEAGAPPFFAAPQAIETALQNPQYKSVLDELYGSEIEPEQMKALTDYQSALTEQGLSKDTEISGIQKRIDEHTLTTQDKVMLGLVLLAPAILGGIIGGKEGVLKSLGGGLEGLATGMQAREDAHLEDVEKLSKAKEAKSDIELKRVQANQAILDAIPNSKLKQALKSRGIEEVLDQEGNVKAYGIPTPDDTLFIDATKVRSEKDLERFDKDDVPAMKELNGYAISINDAIDDMDFILDQLKGKTGSDQLLEEKLPFLQDKVMTREGDMIRAGEALKTIDEALRDKYRKLTKIKGFGPDVTEHFGGLLSGPYDEESVWKGRDMGSVISKARQFRGLMNKAHERNLQSAGFLVDPFKKKVGESEQFQKGEQERKSNLAMNFLRKNPKEWEKAQKGQFVGGK